MRKVILVGIAAIVFLNSCTSSGMDKELQGEWKVVSVNCPEVLAEKEGKRKVFQYHHSSGKNHLVSFRVAECKKNVKSGWIIQVGEVFYSFFPPAVK